MPKRKTTKPQPLPPETDTQLILASMCMLAELEAQANRDRLAALKKEPDQPQPTSIIGGWIVNPVAHAAGYGIDALCTHLRGVVGQHRAEAARAFAYDRAMGRPATPPWGPDSPAEKARREEAKAQALADAPNATQH